jgi:hypothetical protein
MVLAISVLLCGVETWIMRKKGESRTVSPEMKFLQEERMHETWTKTKWQEQQVNKMYEEINTYWTEYNIQIEWNQRDYQNTC